MRQPVHQPQLNRGTWVPGRTRGSKDCGPRTVQMGLFAITDGYLRPDIPDIRRRMGRIGPQQTNTSNAQQCVQSYGLQYFRKSDVESVKKAVANGKPVQLALDYGVLNDRLDKTGDPNFRGGHSVLVFGQKKASNGDILWRLYDPLDDGRRSGIPQGPRWVKRAALVAALKAFGTSSGVYAGVFQWKK